MYLLPLSLNASSKEEKEKARKLINNGLSGLLALICKQNPSQQGCEKLRESRGLKVLEPEESYHYKGVHHTYESKKGQKMVAIGYWFKLEGIKIGGKKGTRFTYKIGPTSGKAESPHNGFQVVNLKGLAEDGLAGKKNATLQEKRHHAAVYGLVSLVTGGSGIDFVAMAKAAKLKSSKDPKIARRFTNATIGGVKAIRYKSDHDTDLFYSETLSIPLLKTSLVTSEKGKRDTIELVKYSKR